MSSGVNRAILVGNLGGKPEIRRTQSGAPVASFSLAINESWRDKSTGERRESVDWFKVVIFNEQFVTIAEKHLGKGSRIYVEGKIKTRKWQDKAGTDHYMTEIVLQAFGSKLVLLDPAERVPAPNESSYGHLRKPAEAMAASEPQTAREALDDEIPF